jgi:hypothetical protein
VTIVPLASRAAVRAEGESREAKEVGFFAALRQGQTTVELLGLDASPITVVDAS